MAALNGNGSSKISIWQLIGIIAGVISVLAPIGGMIAFYMRDRDHTADLFKDVYVRMSDISSKHGQDHQLLMDKVELIDKNKADLVVLIDKNKADIIAIIDKNKAVSDTKWGQESTYDSEVRSRIESMDSRLNERINNTSIRLHSRLDDLINRLIPPEIYLPSYQKKIAPGHN